MNNQVLKKVIKLTDLWSIFLKRLWVLVLVAFISMSLAFVGIRMAYTPRYESTATLYILRQNESATSTEASTDFSLALKVVNDCTYMLKSHTVLDAVKEELTLEQDYATLYNSVSTANPEGTRILEVTVEADTPEMAKAIVDKICFNGTEVINTAMGFSQVNLYESGILDPEPCNRTGLRTYFFVGVAAACATYLVFVLIFLLDDVIRTDEDWEHYLNLTVLASIPEADSGNSKSYGYGVYGGKKKDSAKKQR